MRGRRAGVTVGATIAATDRDVDLGAGLWPWGAGATDVRRAALRGGREATELIGAALDAAARPTRRRRRGRTLATVIHGDALAVGDALVRVGLAVAATDRIVDGGADGGGDLAGARLIRAATVIAFREDADLAGITHMAAATTAALALGAACALRCDAGASGFGHTGVAVGVAVAATDRRVLFGADGRGDLAGAQLISGAAHRVVGEDADRVGVGAGEARDAAAVFGLWIDRIIRATTSQDADEQRASA